jgi:hypothetical protein
MSFPSHTDMIPRCVAEDGGSFVEEKAVFLLRFWQMGGESHEDMRHAVGVLSNRRIGNPAWR